jgi:hypothetical protein
VVGLALLCWAASRIRRRVRYGKSLLRLSSTPIEVGGRLAGAVVIPGSLDPAAGFDVTLDCIRRATDSSGDTSDTVIWRSYLQGAKPVPAGAEEPQTAIPISIPIPSDCEPWNDEALDRQVIWRLRVAAVIARGPDLDQVFDVPVFGTRSEPPREPLPDGFLRAPAKVAAPASTRVRIAETARGVEILFPPSGGRKSVLGVLIAFSATAAAALGIAMAGAPILFPLVVGVFGMIPTLLILWSAAGSVRISIGPQELELAYVLLGLRKAWTVPKGDVVEACISAMVQSGRSSGYTILLRRRTGNPLHVLAAIADKSEADWLASLINSRLPSARSAVL